ncbi:MAG: protein TolR [Burkholderiaceae bacterium]
MAGSVSRGSQMRGGRSRRAMSDINVVPYIDVMLVLLIIFMVAAPLSAPGTIDLPNVAKSSQAKQDPISVIVKADKTIRIKDTKSGTERSATVKEVGAIVQQMQGGDAERPVVISGDKKVEYDAILQVMDGLKQQGIARVGLAVKPSN